MSNKITHLIRLEISFGYFGDEDKIYEQLFLINKETEKGYWIKNNKTFVLKGRGKRLAHENREGALEYLLARKRRRVNITRNNTLRAERELRVVEKQYTEETGKEFI